MSKLYLASASPRRAELLAQIGVRFERLLPAVDEQRGAGESPRDYVSRLAREKALAGWQMLSAQYEQSHCCVLGADTIVVQGDRVFEKPAGEASHLEMMRALSGRCHRVYTAAALQLPSAEPGAGSDASESPRHTLISCTEVRFKPLSDADIQAYWATGEPCDKAGGYAIQGIGALLVESISGSYSGVVGLPLFETGEMLRAAGVATALQG